MKISLKILSIVALFLSSACQLTGVSGNGNVRIEDRSISDNFEVIHISRGLVLDLTSGPNTTLTVEADENLHELIQIEVEDGVLKIYTDENIWRATAKTIHLATNHVVGIRATSGAEVKGRDVIKTENFEVSVTSGAYVDLDLEVSKLNCAATSGTNVKLRGRANRSKISATSGSNIKAKELRTNTSIASVTSGANVSIYVSDSLVANATSGGNINFEGNPKSVKKNSSSGGNINKD